MSQEIRDGLARLRSPFPDNQIGWLPKPMKKKEEMDKIPKIKCEICGQYHAREHVMHLSYVGHAALTDRFLDVDPGWYWEPLAFGPDGLPQLDRDGGLWIRLTILGVTRIGYGAATATPSKATGDVMKERIGDALRNAGMRFGCALEMWHKGDLNAHKHLPVPQEELPKGAKPIKKERFDLAIVQIKAGNYTVEQLQKYALTEDQQEELDDLIADLGAAQ